MNRSHLLKKLAVSALLMSTVAAPVITNAASSKTETSPKVSAHMISTPAAEVTNAFSPLELVKTYAPNTVKDWEKTLEQYKKVVGEKNNISSSIEMIKSEPAAKLEDANIEVETEGKDYQAPSESVSASVATSATKASEVTNALTKAQIALSDAIESKNPTAIKDALAKLLDQYKQEIADHKLAK